MTTTVYLLDEYNFYVDIISLEDYDINEIKFTATPMTIGYIKPRFDFTINDWEEGATEKEILEWKEINTPKSIVTKQDLLKRVESYKHEYIEFIDYDGNKQRTLDSDIIKIQGAEKSLSTGSKQSITWKYPAEYKVVTDPDYFWQMQLMIMDATEHTYITEMILLQEINSLTEEQANTYNLEERFDQVFKSL